VLTLANPLANGQSASMDVGVSQLDRLWQQSTARLNRRLVDLADHEYFWQPVDDCWTVHRVPGANDRWTIDYDWPPPVPAPLTTIAWRIVHVANGNTIYLEHAFGPAVRTFMDLDLPRTAADAVAYLNVSCEAVTERIRQSDDADLTEMRPSHLGSPRSAGEVLCILVDEITHHGAEIGLLRDLYLRYPDRRFDDA